MPIDQSRYDNLYARFQKQVSIPDFNERLTDDEVRELILAMQADMSTSGQRAAKKSSGVKTTKAKASPPSADAMANLLKMAQALQGGPK